MQLRFAPTSPYVRKVMVLAMETGLDDRIEKVVTNPWEVTDLSDDNPLGKVPALTTEEGLVLCDSPVVCEYLDSLHGGAAMIPASGAARWAVLNTQALADGILDSAVGRAVERRMRPEEKQWEEGQVRQRGKIWKTLGLLETQTGGSVLSGPVNLGQIAVGCALGYLDLRFADEDWRKDHPNLAAWYEIFGARDSMQETTPPA